MSTVEEKQKGPIKDAIAALITKENLGKLIMLIITALSKTPTTTGEPTFMGDEKVGALSSALEDVPEDQRAACVEECIQELCDEGKIAA